MKLKVGDIEMDSQTGISFGAQPARTANAMADAQVGQRVDGAKFWERLPAWSPRTYRWLAGFALAAALGLVLVVGVFIEAQAVGRFLPLIPVPGLLLAAGIGFGQATFRSRGDGRPSPETLDLERAERLSEHLRERVLPASVEELMAALSWREEAVVSGLKVGVAKNRIIEDLDLDTGHWIYAAAPAAEAYHPRRALPVAERAKQLTSNE